MAHHQPGSQASQASLNQTLRDLASNCHQIVLGLHPELNGTWVVQHLGCYAKDLRSGAVGPARSLQLPAEARSSELFRLHDLFLETIIELHGTGRGNGNAKDALRVVSELAEKPDVQ